jgi:hypothetical protein
MNRILLIGCIGLSLIGCSQIKQVKSDITACYNDQACYETALQKAAEAGRKAGDLASLSGFPWAEKVATPLFGYGTLIFTLAALWKKKRQENPA